MSASTNAVWIDHRWRAASTKMIVAGMAAVTIDHELRASVAMSDGFSTRWPCDRLDTRRERMWAIQMAMAPTMTTPAVVSSPGFDSNVRPAMATRVAMVP